MSVSAPQDALDPWQLEAKSTHDDAWYDCDVVQRPGGLCARFLGYGTDEEEPIADLAALRFSSLAAEPADCPQLLPGARVSAFKRSPHDQLWVDAEVVGKRPGRHDGGKCMCGFTVRWLDTADAGRTAELRVGDLCLLDPRQLSEHPQYETYRAALAKTAAGSGSDRVVVLEDSDGSGSGEGQGGGEAPPPRRFAVQPPAGAAGPPCALCRLPTLAPLDPAAAELALDDQRNFQGLTADRHVVHRRCAAFSSDSALSYPGRHQLRTTAVPSSLRVGFSGAVGAAQLQRCTLCGEGGATARCAAPTCRKTFHLHCTAGCKVDVEGQELRCPAHSLQSAARPLAAPHALAPAAARARLAEMDGMRRGKVRRTAQLSGLAATPKRRASPGPADRRRSSRHGNKRIRYNESLLESQPFSESWQRRLSAPRRAAPASSDEEEDEEEGSVSGLMQDESDDESGNFVDEHRRRPGPRRPRQPSPSRRPQRERTKVKSYAEEQEELELKVEAYREAERAKSGYEDTCCEACGSKSRGKEMLLCDGCDAGYHMFCLDPPLAAAPLAFWFCPGCLPHQACEACGHSGSGATKRRGRELRYCGSCGALCHAACMQDGGGDGGEPQCRLCAEGLQDVEAVLGCRTPAGREGGREYFVKWRGKGYRRCSWVSDAAAARMAPAQLARFERDTRGAAAVEPAVQPQWVEVERVVATRHDVEAGREEVLVKWRGLEYDKATWEPRDALEGGEEAAALQQFERRMALRVVRDAAAEERARRAAAVAGQGRVLAGQPGFLEGVGALKDYQLEGVAWVLSKLAAGVSGILGDEMGLGKTIQTAVALQLARQRGLTTGPVAVVVPLSTFGGWERELAKWAPGLEVLSYSGHQGARALICRHELGGGGGGMDEVRRGGGALMPRFHVMLTTYDVAVRDAAVLRGFDWSALVIDEGHSLKGQDSQRGKALRQLGAPWRLLLTGTPLQNNLRELLALLAFMADCSVEQVERLVQRQRDPNPPTPGSPGGGADAELAAAQAYIRKLHAYLEPRMLRRMKATSLAGQVPPKITRPVACRMTPLQARLYADILAKDYERLHAMVRNRLERKGMANVLMRLRQACNHPYLLPGQEPEEYKDPADPAVAARGWRLMVAASGKLSLLRAALPRLLADGRRVLIFSQFVEMLDILEDFLHDFQDDTGLLPPAQQDRPASGGGADSVSERATASGEEGGSEEHNAGEEEECVRGRPGSVIRYFRLDGTTKGWQRQAMMDSFNSPDCQVKVFLISTRAGSLGINLQAADTVVLYDPDFNPFVDAQAEGRAHRLGQQETVLVLQLHTAASVEERILALAAKKRKLEELVTRHLGRARDVSDDDVRSSVLHGWGNLMAAAEEDGKRGGDVALGAAELERLLDRARVYEGDAASGADAAALLGEVRAGGAAAMTFERGGSADAPGGDADQGAADMEAAMLRLIRERAAKFEADQAARQELGRGRRTRGNALNYCEQEQDRGLREMLGDEDDDSPDKASGGGQRRKGGAPGDDDYDPLASLGNGENAQPNAASSPSSASEDAALVAPRGEPGGGVPSHRQGPPRSLWEPLAGTCTQQGPAAAARPAAAAQQRPQQQHSGGGVLKLVHQHGGVLQFVLEDSPPPASATARVTARQHPQQQPARAVPPPARPAAAKLDPALQAKAAARLAAEQAANHAAEQWQASQQAAKQQQPVGAARPAAAQADPALHAEAAARIAAARAASQAATAAAAPAGPAQRQLAVAAAAAAPGLAGQPQQQPQQRPQASATQAAAVAQRAAAMEAVLVNAAARQAAGRAQHAQQAKHQDVEKTRKKKKARPDGAKTAAAALRAANAPPRAS